MTGIEVAVVTCRLRAGLKLHEEAEKKEVEQGIYLLEDPEGKGYGSSGWNVVFE